MGDLFYIKYNLQAQNVPFQHKK